MIPSSQGGPAVSICLLLLFSLLRDILSSRRRLVLENLGLRQQLAVLSRQKRRPRLKPADRLFSSGLLRLWSGWQSALFSVRPETVLRWQRTTWRQYWTLRSRHRRTRGRPRIPREVQELVRCLDRASSSRQMGQCRPDATRCRHGVRGCHPGGVSSLPIGRRSRLGRRPPE